MIILLPSLERDQDWATRRFRSDSHVTGIEHVGVDCCHPVCSSLGLTMVFIQVKTSKPRSE